MHGVQGLRTVAALLVAVYHIWFGRVSGGVDVFFVVAGYFAIGSLYRSFTPAVSALDVLGNLRSYLLRVLRRVVPSAAVVIAATVVLGWIWLPQTAQRSASPFGWSAVGFIENWKLIAASADYAAQEDAASPFQQFWALGVNVQFYVLFALVVATVAVVLRRRRPRTDLRRPLTFLSAGIFVTSFAFSVYYTSADQAAAYFNTFTRLWEFMAGSLLFLLMRGGLKNKNAARIAGWAGLMMLLFLGGLIDLSRLLPGYMSLLPVAAACGIIIASRSSADPAPLLWKPFQSIADASFALYLWHWPLLVVYRHLYGPSVSLCAGLGIILLSIALAVVTTKFVENPLRNSPLLSRSWQASIASLVAILLVPVSLLAAWDRSIQRHEEQAWSKASDLTSSQPAIDESQRITVDDLIPHPSIAKDDAYQDVETDNCVQRSKVQGVKTCTWGNAGSDKRVTLVGGSHSEQWAQSVRRAAEEADAEMVTYLKSSCVFSMEVTKYVEVDQSCVDWNEEVLQAILDDPQPCW